MRQGRRSPLVSSGRLRTLAALGAVLALSAGCGGGSATSAPSVGPLPTPSASVSASMEPQAPFTASAATASASAQAQATSKPTSAPTVGSTAAAKPLAWHWESAGAMAVARAGPHAIRLTDGRVLVVGNDSYGVRDDSATAELYDPGTNRWRATASLNRPRADFAAVPLLDGRALVTGGLDRGVLSPTATPDTACSYGQQQSYTSTYLYDPRPGHETWARTGLLGEARTGASAAVLADGRVLIAGGYYDAGRTADVAPYAALALYRPASTGPGAAIRGPVADVSPDVVATPLTTAELFDPTTGTWSPTGSLHYGRLNAAAVTLTDGRVLVVGSDEYAGLSQGRAVGAAAEASVSAEIYDSKTGRFSLTGDFPPTDPAALKKVGLTADLGTGEPSAIGTLVALADGGALLVGSEQYWKHFGEVARALRFDARSGKWTNAGETFLSFSDPVTGQTWESPGVSRLHALVARLPDGRVLVAGGETSRAAGQTFARSAELYDPASGAWSTLPPMPSARAGGAAVTLADGSMLLLGGYDDKTSGWVECDQPSGLASAVRLVPSP